MLARREPLRTLAISALLTAGCQPHGADLGPAPPKVTEKPKAHETRKSDQATRALVSAIDPARLTRTVETLAGFGTRHTLSETQSEQRGIGAARRWIKGELEASVGIRPEGPPLTVRFDPHRIKADGRRVFRDVDVVNVVATLPGTMPQAAGRHYYVVAHYDSRASDPNDATSDAPGANDDASGVAIVLELARVMATRRYDATLVFMVTAGEEQGLLGADRHAQVAAESGVDIRGVLSNDIVGDPTGPHDRTHDHQVRVFSASLAPWLHDEDLAAMRTLSGTHDGPSRQLARFVQTVARDQALDVQPMLIFRRDRFLRGGDHTAFNRAGFPGIRMSEVEENYDRQHQDVRQDGDRSFGDLPAHVDATYLAGVAQINAAALAHLANAPSPPADAKIIATALTNDTTLSWSASPEPDVAGYEVVWRATTSPTWDHSRDVGDAVEHTLDQSKDNWFFGVRAYDHDGYRSPVVFPTVQRK